MSQRHGFIFALAFTVALGATTSAHAGTLTYLGRLLGMGWSDGYHVDDVRYGQAGQFNYAPSTIPPQGYNGPPPGYNGPPPGYVPRPGTPVPAQRPTNVPNQGPLPYRGNPQNGAGGVQHYVPPSQTGNW